MLLGNQVVIKLIPVSLKYLAHPFFQSTFHVHLHLLLSLPPLPRTRSSVKGGYQNVPFLCFALIIEWRQMLWSVLLFGSFTACCVTLLYGLFVDTIRYVNVVISFGVGCVSFNNNNNNNIMKNMDFISLHLHPPTISLGHDDDDITVYVAFLYP